MSYARELYLKSLLDKAGSGGGSGTYANDTWLLENLIGQAPAFSFGTPISKTTAIYIPWIYPKQTRWTSTQLLPNITNFTQYIEPSGNTTQFDIANEASGNWIRTSDPSFVLVINKNSVTNGFSNITYSDSSGTSYNAYAYSYYNSSLVNLLGDETTQNKITGWYSNPSEFGTTIKTSLTFGGFLTPGLPSEPRNISISNPNVSVSSLTVNWNPPEFADTKTRQGLISSYDISYNSVGSSIRHPSAFAHPNLSSNGITGLTKIITGLYPDSSYSFQVSATNDTGGKGLYSTIFVGSTINLSPMSPLSSISFNVTPYTNGTTTTHFINSDRSGTAISNPLLKQADINATVTVPIHRVNNRGKLGTGTNLMNLSAKLNTNIDASVNYTGFPINIPADASAGFVTIQTNYIRDNYTDFSYNQGFYLNANSTITVRKEGFIPRNTLNTISCSQKFTNNSGSNSSANYSFYYDTPITQAPTGAINTITIAQSNFKQVSGIYVLQGYPTISIDTSANNMGNYFYSNPLINYTCTIGGQNATKSENDLVNVNSTDVTASATISGGKLNFKSSINYSNALSIFSKTVLVTATANNIFGSGSLTSKTINVITDGPSCTLVYTTLAQSIPTLTAGLTDYAGYRIWSAPDVSNNCPLLSSFSAPYKDKPYDNSWNITSTNNNGIDATTELQIYNGFFCTKTANSTNAYIDYSSYLYNSFNYSTILSTSGNYRFASFCWKLNPSLSSYTGLSFTINSISPNPTKTSNGYILIDGVQIPIFYSFQDTATNVYSNLKFNSVWINANSNVNNVDGATYFNDNNKYGTYTGNGSTSISGNNANNANIIAFIPSVNPVLSTVYLYLRICIPMNKNISFGSVTAKLT